jgi:hypothetical protein
MFEENMPIIGVLQVPFDHDEEVIPAACGYLTLLR